MKSRIHYARQSALLLTFPQQMSIAGTMRDGWALRHSKRVSDVPDAHSGFSFCVRRLRWLLCDMIHRLGIHHLLVVCALLAAPSHSDAQLEPAVGTSKLEQILPLLSEAQSLQGRKRYIDALFKLDDAEKLAPERAEIYNIRGAIYLAAMLRDAKIAREQFTKARELQPTEMPPYFNLGEVDFVQQNWPDAQATFEDVLRRFPKLPLHVHHLVLFKILVSMAQQDKLADAEKLLVEHFTFLDDTPAYYFAKAVLAKRRNAERDCNDWLTKAQIIFKPNATSSYLDTLMESHIVDSLSVPNAGDSQ